MILYHFYQMRYIKIHAQLLQLAQASYFSIAKLTLTYDTN